MKKTVSYSLLDKIRILLWSSRPVSWINTAFPFAIGYLFVHGIHHIAPVFWIATMYFLIPYNMLVYVVNDVFDYESDLRNPRKGGVEGALLPKQLHSFMLKAVAVCNIPFIVYLLFQSTTLATLILLVCIFDALAYSVPYLRFKERPLVDSVSSSFHFVSPLLFALSLQNALNGNWLYIIAFFCWGIASHAFGAVQDIIPDRQAGLASIATNFGAKNTVRFSVVFYAIAIVLVAVKGWPALVVAIASLPYLLITVPYIHLTDKQSARANRGWRYFMQINQFVGFIVTIVFIIDRIM